MHTKSQKVGVTPQEIEAFFFRAMVEGYASGKKPERDFPLPGWKTLTFQEGDLRLVDMWYTTPGSPKSGGITIISCDNLNVWDMHYGGRYEEQTIPFLRDALMVNYSTSLFLGGRGPECWGDGSFLYVNKPRENAFVQFQGMESILDKKGKLKYGYHWYRGQWLVRSAWD